MLEQEAFDLIHQFALSPCWMIEIDGNKARTSSALCLWSNPAVCLLMRVSHMVLHHTSMIKQYALQICKPTVSKHLYVMLENSHIRSNFVLTIAHLCTTRCHFPELPTSLDLCFNPCTVGMLFAQLAHGEKFFPTNYWTVSVSLSTKRCSPYSRCGRMLFTSCLLFAHPLCPPFAHGRGSLIWCDL